MPSSSALVRVTVRDDGLGMGEAVLAKLFEPFFTTKEAGKGTGLGLSIVHGILAQAGGFPRVRSALGEGTSVEIYLPSQEGVELDPQDRELEHIPRGAGELVLVAEDEVLLLSLVQVMLEKLGYRVLPAESAGLAWQVFQQHREEIRLVLTDLVMPEMNGRELADRILGEAPELPVPYMSRCSSSMLSRSGLSREEEPFLQKPFTLSELGTRVRRAMTTPG